MNILDFATLVIGPALLLAVFLAALHGAMWAGERAARMLRTRGNRQVKRALFPAASEKASAGDGG